MPRRLLNLLTALSLLLCVTVVAHWLSAQPRRYLFMSGNVAFPFETKALLWLERRDNPEVIHVMLDRYIVRFGFLYGTLRPSYRVLGVPHWPVACIAAAGPTLWCLARLREHRQIRRRDQRLCARCGYDLRATPGRCPECGTAGNVNS
jgi:hypothetical protein